MAFDIDKAKAVLGDPKAKRVKRDGDRDLAFTGWLLGSGEHGTGGTSGYSCDWNRGVHVRVWLTTTGKLVTGAERWSRWQGEGERWSAEAHDDPEAAYAWLREDSADGELGPASKAAWEAACAAWPGLDGADVEVVP